MQEVLVTTDRGLLSRVKARLDAAGIKLLTSETILPTATAGSQMVLHRLLVEREAQEMVRRLIETLDRVDSGMLSTTISHDALLGGRVRLAQPCQGYRVAVDAVALAAAVAARPGERVLDLGTGVGACALCLAVRVPGVLVTGLELQPALAALAADNVGANDLVGRVNILTGDLRYPPPELAPASFDRVMANPPYLRPGSHTPSPDLSRATANSEGEASLSDWIDVAARMLRPRGYITLVHRADRLDEVISLLHKEFGALVLFPLWPRAGVAAKRILFTGRLGAASPSRLAAGLVLHGDGGGFTAGAQAVLRDGGGLEL